MAALAANYRLRVESDEPPIYPAEKKKNKIWLVKNNKLNLQHEKSSKSI